MRNHISKPSRQQAIPNKRSNKKQQPGARRQARLGRFDLCLQSDLQNVTCFCLQICFLACVESWRFGHCLGGLMAHFVLKLQAESGMETWTSNPNGKLQREQAHSCACPSVTICAAQHIRLLKHLRLLNANRGSTN